MKNQSFKQVLGMVGLEILRRKGINPEDESFGILGYILYESLMQHVAMDFPKMFCDIVNPKTNPTALPLNYDAVVELSPYIVAQYTKFMGTYDIRFERMATSAEVMDFTNQLRDKESLIVITNGQILGNDKTGEGTLDTLYQEIVNGFKDTKANMRKYWDET